MFLVEIPRRERGVGQGKINLCSIALLHSSSSVSFILLNPIICFFVWELKKENRLNELVNGKNVSTMKLLKLNYN